MFFPLPNKEPVVPTITGQNAEYYQTSILKRCNSRSSLFTFGSDSFFFKHYFIRNFMVITLRGGGMGVRLEKQTTNNFRPGVLISLLSLDIVYSTYRKNILRVFKNVTFRFNTDANQLRLSCGFIFLQVLPFGNLSVHE